MKILLPLKRDPLSDFNLLQYTRRAKMLSQASISSSALVPFTTSTSGYRDSSLMTTIREITISRRTPVISC